MICCNIIRMNDRFGWFMMFNTTLNNISVISWRSALLVEETGVTELFLSHNVVMGKPRLSGIRIHDGSGDMHR